MADVVLVGEVTSPGSFRQDRIVKHRDDASAGIPFYVRIDLDRGIDELTASGFELVDGIAVVEPRDDLDPLVELVVADIT